MDAGAIDGTRHDSTKGIDFLDQMPLADTTNGRIAGHLADGIDILREQQAGAAAARHRRRCLNARVAASYHNDRKGIFHVLIILSAKASGKSANRPWFPRDIDRAILHKNSARYCLYEYEPLQRK